MTKGHEALVHCNNFLKQTGLASVLFKMEHGMKFIQGNKYQKIDGKLSCAVQTRAQRMPKCAARPIQ